MRTINTKPNLPEELHGLVFRASDILHRNQRGGNPDPLSTGIPRLDELLGGGWPRGSLSEICGGISSGRFSTILATVRCCLSRGLQAAFIDQSCHLDPGGIASMGVEIRRLLWARPTSTHDSLLCAELLLSAGFPLVAIDLGFSPAAGRIPPAAWLRISRLSADHHAVTLLSSPFRISGCAARTALHFRKKHSRWHGAPGMTPMLGSITNRVQTLKSPHPPQHTISGFSIDLPDTEYPGQPYSKDIKTEVKHHA